MRIAVCEDNEIHCEIIMRMLNRCALDLSLSLELTPYESGKALLYDVEDGTYFDIAFLDIYLKDTMGIDVAHGLRAMDYDGKLVFLTASPDFAIESYDVSASGYLLKPVNYDKLKTVLKRLTADYDPNTYQIRQRTTVTRLKHRNILYIESSNSKCMLHTVSGNVYTVYKTLNTIEQELADPSFLRCHQSFLVNMAHVRQIGKQFQLTSGEIIPIRQRGIKPVRQAYMAYTASNPDVR